MILVEHLIRHIRSTLGGKPNPYLDELRIVNEAGRHVASMHTWRFLMGEQATLAVEASKDYIPMPTDWGAMAPGQTPIVPSSRTTSTFEFVTLDRLNLIRQSSVENTETYWVGALEWRDGITGWTGPPTVGPTDALWPCLALWPTPETADTDKFRMRYIRTWVEQTSGEGKVAWPPWMQTLLQRSVTLLARGYEEDQDNPMAVEQFQAALSQSEAFKAARTQDGRMQPGLGRMRGGAVNRRGSRTHFLASKVENPS